MRLVKKAMIDNEFDKTKIYMRHAKYILKNMCYVMVSSTNLPDAMKILLEWLTQYNSLVMWNWKSLLSARENHMWIKRIRF